MHYTATTQQQAEIQHLVSADKLFYGTITGLSRNGRETSWVSEQVSAQDGKYVTVFELSKYAIIYLLGVLATDHCVS